MTHPAPESNTIAFQLQMLAAARLGFPTCALPTDSKLEDRVVIDETFYSVLWSSQGGSSKTMKLNALVVNLETGRSMGVEDILSKMVRKGEQLSIPRRGTHMGRSAASHALAELAFRHTQALVLWNPVTGPVQMAVSA